jgi:alpha-glucosidase
VGCGPGARRGGAGDSVLAFARGSAFGCPVNLGKEPVPLAGRGDVLLASGAVSDVLPPDTAVWLAPRAPS